MNSDEDCGMPAEEEKWRTGVIQTLEPEDDPVFLGDIRPGTHQLAVGSNMFKAPACAYRPQRSDFLLVRQASGTLLLRELTGYVAVGQQEPLMRIPTPATKDVRWATAGACPMLSVSPFTEPLRAA